MPPPRPGRVRAIVYVDRFNPSHGCLKGTPERWLDVGALCKRVLSRDSEIVGIRYFTARVKPRVGDPHAAQRQQVYLRALATVPNLTLHYGAFMTKAATRRCVKDRRGKPRYAEVWITEEKGLGREPREPPPDRRLSRKIRPRRGGLERRRSQVPGPLRATRPPRAGRSPHPPPNPQLLPPASGTPAWIVLQADPQSRAQSQPVPVRGARRTGHHPQAAKLVGS